MCALSIKYELPPLAMSLCSPSFPLESSPPSLYTVSAPAPCSDGLCRDRTRQRIPLGFSESPTLQELVASRYYNFAVFPPSLRVSRLAPPHRPVSGDLVCRYLNSDRRFLRTNLAFFFLISAPLSTHIPFFFHPPSTSGFPSPNLLCVSRTMCGLSPIPPSILPQF